MAPLEPVPRRPSRGLAIAMTILTGLWIAGVLVVLHAVGWFAGEVFTELEIPAPGWLVPAVAWVPAVLAVVPAILLATLSRVDFARTAGRVWLEAIVIGAILGTVRMIPVTYREVYLAVLALVALALALALLRGSSAKNRPGDHNFPEVVPKDEWLSIACGLVILAPWLWLGALGGLVETVLAAAACVAIGWLSGRRLAPLLSVGLSNRWGRMAITGLLLGVGLAGVATGIGQNGVDVLELVVLPVVGFVAGGLAKPSLTTLVAIAAFGPLGFVDPLETTLLLGTEDVAYWAIVAAAATLGLAVALGAVIPAFRPKKRWVAATVAVVVTVGAAVVYAGPGQPGLYGERVFVVMKQQADLGGLEAIADRDERLRQTYKRLVDTADASQAGLRKALKARGLHFRPYYLVNGLEVDGGQVVRSWLANRDDVDRVLLNPQLRPLPRAAGVMHGHQPAPTGPQWNLTSIGADQVWSQLGVTGEGITVGGSDSGVDGSHPELGGNFRGGKDSWLDPFGPETSPVDYNGHGTHTLASAVGAKVGVAPGAKWIGCVNLPRNIGSPAAYLTCMQFMLAPYPRSGDPLHDGDPTRAPEVLTNSWGCPELEGCDRNALKLAVQALSAAGIYFVVAAGNSGPDCGTVEDAPATYPDPLTVGAVDQRGRLTDFSSRGPAPGGLAKPDVVAPGAHVLSALPGNGYGYLDGTSMATPHVAGVVALMYSANPKLIGNIRRTSEILRQTATPISTPNACGGLPDTVGAGEVNALAAVRAAEQAG
jgi:subtilisin family serine protease